MGELCVRYTVVRERIAPPKYHGMSVIEWSDEGE